MSTRKLFSFRIFINIVWKRKKRKKNLIIKLTFSFTKSYEKRLSLKFSPIKSTPAIRKKNFLLSQDSLRWCGYLLGYYKWCSYIYIIRTYKWYIHTYNTVTMVWIYFFSTLFSTQRPTLVKSIYEVFRGLG